jgi:hypothetical protein
MIDLELLLQPGVGKLKACQRHGFLLPRETEEGGRFADIGKEIGGRSVTINLRFSNKTRYLFQMRSSIEPMAM